MDPPIQRHIMATNIGCQYSL